MNIHEAIMARTHEKPYITRRDWGYITVNPVAVSIKILPTNSPDGCVVESVSAEGPRSGWQPTAGDLAAEDWETVEKIEPKTRKTDGFMAFVAAFIVATKHEDIFEVLPDVDKLPGVFVF